MRTKDKKLNDMEEIKFKSYPRRWGILATVVLLNISNASIWISYFPVATTTVNYFEKSQNAINWFSYVFMIIPAACFIMTTYLSHKHGLKFLVLTGTAFNLAGATIKAVATSGLFDSKDTQYAIALTGQIIAAVAQTFAIYIPTKVSHSWFPKNERGFVTAVLSLSYSLGVTLTTLITPAIVKGEESNIPVLDYICFGIAALTEVLSIVLVTRSHPKTPPSSTAGKENESSLSYWEQLLSAFRCRPFVILLILYSLGIGVIAGFITLTQQILCTVGYSDQFSGSCVAIMYFSGYIGASIITPLAHTTGKYEEIVKLILGLICISFIGLCEMTLIPNMAVMVAILYAFFGFCSTGSLPTGLELIVESTYPMDESIPIGLIYFLGQFSAILSIYVITALAREVDFDYDKNVCGLDGENLTQRDYSISVSAMMAIFTIIYMSGLILFKPIFKRRDYELSQTAQIRENKSDNSTFCQEPHHLN